MTMTNFDIYVCATKVRLFDASLSIHAQPSIIA